MNWKSRYASSVESHIEFVDPSSKWIDQAAKMMFTSPPWNKLNFDMDQCKRELKREGTDVYVVLEGDTLQAFIAIIANGLEDEPMIEFLCVASKMRGKGIGTRLVNFFESKFPDAANLYMFVSDINPKAKALYEKLGYDQVGLFKDFNLVGQTEYLMRKSRRPRQENF
jgi:ribosomal protein S18 acetylase RimI-like enzyme